jgi:hypothetical protein
MHTTQAGSWSLGHCFTILAVPVQALSYHLFGDQHICFNPTYHPHEQWLEVWSILNPGNLVSHTQVFNPDKPVLMLFDAYAAIDQGGCGGIGCGYGGLAWERAYTSNDKCMWWGDNSWPRDDMVPIIVLIGVVFHGPHGKRQNMQPSFTRGQLPLTLLLAPVTL